MSDPVDERRGPPGSRPEQPPHRGVVVQFVVDADAQHLHQVQAPDRRIPHGDVAEQALGFARTEAVDRCMLGVQDPLELGERRGTRRRAVVAPATPRAQPTSDTTQSATVPSAATAHATREASHTRRPANAVIGKNGSSTSKSRSRRA